MPNQKGDGPIIQEREGDDPQARADPVRPVAVDSANDQQPGDGCAAFAMTAEDLWIGKPSILSEVM
jgi:hypothetical protein